MKNPYSEFEQELELLGAKSSLRALPAISGFSCDFTSNDYLGLSENESLKQAVFEASKGLPFGSGGSRLLGGAHDWFSSCETSIAQWLGLESALLFNSGYQANVGVVSALVGPGDVVFLDKRIHASMVDGLRLSGAKWFRFSHLDTAHLSRLMHEKRRHFKKALILTESLYSMEGDVADIPALIRLKHEHDALLIVDEAHALGVLGPEGRGMVAGVGMMDQVDGIIGTFGKAFGSSGAFFAGSDILKQWFINKARSFVYSTALPTPVVIWNQMVIERNREWEVLRKSVLENAALFRSYLAGVSVLGGHYIVPVVAGSNESAMKLAAALRNRGIHCLAVRPPTVPPNRALLRFSIRANHTPFQLEEVSHVLKQSLE